MSPEFMLKYGHTNKNVEAPFPLPGTDVYVCGLSISVSIFN
ncbi:unnamed protein product [Strongylus vulgaris]|uniref:Uncharacterized protein n=1 Tax=Strongylus vulgaris TaxID=40348 RepID=A0A3P7IE74_STRVU|nr:unnamed protein product [Strongylus vulgaris]